LEASKSTWALQESGALLALSRKGFVSLAVAIVIEPIADLCCRDDGSLALSPLSGEFAGLGAFLASTDAFGLGVTWITRSTGAGFALTSRISVVYFAIAVVVYTITA
jgi:hypothetical protein